MNENTIAGVRRGTKFSPNHIGNDEAIFRLTAEELRSIGWTVNEYSEAALLEYGRIAEPYIFNMARDSKSVRNLQTYERAGRTVINSGFGIENCTRERMTRLLVGNSIPHPKSVIASTSGDASDILEKAGLNKCWVKRGDFHAIHREDVTYVRNRDEAQNILREYAIRGIGNAVVNEHLYGDLVKFYGVAGTDFFYYFYPGPDTHSKFGWEKINGTARGIPFDRPYLQEICNRAAEVLNIQIYGGDCVVSEDSEIFIIDFNDWPSFAACRKEAAPYIVSRIDFLIKNRT